MVSRVMLKSRVSHLAMKHNIHTLAPHDCIVNRFCTRCTDAKLRDLLALDSASSTKSYTYQSPSTSVSPIPSAFVPVILTSKIATPNRIVRTGFTVKSGAPRDLARHAFCATVKNGVLKPDDHQIVEAEMWAMPTQDVISESALYRKDEPVNKLTRRDVRVIILKSLIFLSCQY
jgi:hypothetical protein